MAATYPSEFTFFEKKYDDLTTVYASDINTIQDEVYALQKAIGINPQMTMVAALPSGGTTPDNLSSRIGLVENGTHTACFSISGTIPSLTANTPAVVTWTEFIQNSHDARKLNANYLGLPTVLYNTENKKTPWMVFVDLEIRTTATVPTSDQPQFTVGVALETDAEPPARLVQTSNSALLMLAAKALSVGQHVPVASYEFFAPNDRITVEVVCSAAWAEVLTVNLSMVQVRG